MGIGRDEERTRRIAENERLCEGWGISMDVRTREIQNLILKHTALEIEHGVFSSK